MNNWIGPIVEYVWNIAVHDLDKFFCLSKTQQLTTWADTVFISLYYRALWLSGFGCAYHPAALGSKRTKINKRGWVWLYYKLFFVFFAFEN